MNKRDKWITIGLISSTAVVAVILNVYFTFFHHYKGKVVIDEWNNSLVFDESKFTVINKDKNKDFVILNLADVQLCDTENYWNASTIHKELTYLVNETKPDLITLTGDQTWSNENLISLKRIISWLDEYKIPYAPVFGNHDYGNDFNSAVASMEYCSDLYEAGKYSLYRRGPTNFETLGNYAVLIKEEGKLYKALYMVDSAYLDIITDEQISYFEWISEGLKSQNAGNYVDGMVFLHKPLPEYRLAYQEWLSDKSIAIGDVHIHFSLSGSIQNGFFSAMKDKGMTDVICGHQHGNSFTFNYQGVRLTNAVKTGEMMSYYDDGIINLNGASTFILKDNNVEIKNYFVDSKTYHISDDLNVYNW